MIVAQRLFLHVSLNIIIENVQDLLDIAIFQRERMIYIMELMKNMHTLKKNME